MLVADYTGQFKKDYRLAIKRGFNIFLAAFGSRKLRMRTD